MSLDGKVAIVSGTGPNVGIEVASALATRGARVMCSDLVLERAEEAKRRISREGGIAEAVAVDITNPESVKKGVAAAVEAFGRVDILVNDAAITHSHGILDTPLEEWQRVINVILTGTFLYSQAAARRMVEQGEGGAIVSLASTSGHRGSGGAIAYATAKGGVLQLTRSMAIALAPHKIRVNSITPSQVGVNVAGNMPGANPADRHSREEGPPPKNIPLGRWGLTRDMAQAVLFLVSPDADFITGADLPVDGGVLAYFPTG